MDSITTTKYLPAATTGGRPVKVALSFNGFRISGGHILSGNGVTVTYALTNGKHTITGADLRTPLGFNQEVGDMVRALCSFLINDADHADAHDRGQWGSPCPEYGDACPARDPQRIAAIEVMRDAIDAASWIGQPA
ncbi:hypothetical protein [Asanoa iriomotensis]|uniref:Uncharacterized protein n=1 Tax=Asanoa iriomotensis TaxID=234613 RepID=A0ABQ4CBT4_9ACTN|nr:hypothetical protein [Asanoa iriomotensis]GIF60233.1 hypothetical protein Air01nite_63280 [Asanoa iriomotensis]